MKTFILVLSHSIVSVKLLKPHFSLEEQKQSLTVCQEDRHENQAQFSFYFLSPTVSAVSGFV